MYRINTIQTIFNEYNQLILPGNIYQNNNRICNTETVLLRKYLQHVAVNKRNETKFNI